MDAVAVIKKLEKRLNERKLYQYRPYGHPDTLCPDGKLWKKMGWEPWSNNPWQLDFHNAGKHFKERMSMSANGTGKTYPGAYEVAVHVTGEYPDWWDGYRFEKANEWWVGSITNEVQRDYLQKVLLGSDLGQGLGTGFIPKENIIGKVKTRQAGISDVADIVSVRHKSGGVSQIKFKTYQQGWRHWQAAAPNGIWLDEEPDENTIDQKDIFTEVQTRLFRSSGILMVTYTPLLGMTRLTEHFMNPKSNQIYYVTGTWDDAPHLKMEDKERLIATYPEYQLDARSKGIPMMGEGRVYTTPEDSFIVEPSDVLVDGEIPRHFARIKGIDFGRDHPAAVSYLAWDRDKDIMYLVWTWRKASSAADITAEHIEAINQKDPWVPVAWPHDGAKKGPKDGVQLKDHYKDKCKMLSKSARFKNDTGGSQSTESQVQMFEDRLSSGGFKVFSTCKEFFDEYRNYHRKDGLIVDRRDDVLKATFYAMMMRRYAATKSMYNPRPSSPPQLVSMRH